MKLQHRHCRVDALFGAYPVDKRIDDCFERLYGSAIYAQLGACAIGIYGFFIEPQELPHAFLHNFLTIVAVALYYLWHFKKIAYAFCQRIVVGDVRHLGGGHTVCISHRYLALLVQIRCAREAKHGCDGALACPAVDHCTQFCLVICIIRGCHMMHFVKQNGEVWQFANLVTQLIGNSILLVSRFVMEVKQSIRTFVYAVEYHFLGICYSHKTEEFGKRLVYGNLLYVRVLGAV